MTDIYATDLGFIKGEVRVWEEIRDTVGGMKFLLDVGAKLKDEDTRPELTKYKEKARELWLEEARLEEEEEKKNKGTS